MKQNRNSQSGFGLVGILLVVVALAAVTGVGVYVYHRNHPTKPTTATNTTPPASQANSNQTSPPSSTTVSSADGKVAITLPDTWRLADGGQTIKTSERSSCLDVDDPSVCVYETALQPKTFNYSNSSQLWSMTVEKSDWTIAQASESLLGDLTPGNTIEQSSAPINGYDALYAKVGSSGSSVGDYTDIHYFIESQGYLVHFSVREKFNGGTGSAADTWDNSAYSSDFAKIVKSLKLNV